MRVVGLLLLVVSSVWGQISSPDDISNLEHWFDAGSIKSGDTSPTFTDSTGLIIWDNEKTVVSGATHAAVIGGDSVRYRTAGYKGRPTVHWAQDFVRDLFLNLSAK